MDDPASRQRSSANNALRPRTPENAAGRGLPAGLVRPGGTGPVSTSAETKPESPTPGSEAAGGAIIGARYRVVSALCAGHEHLIYCADDLHIAGRQVVLKMTTPARARA